VSMPEVPPEDRERAHEKQQAADCSVEYVQSGMVGAGHWSCRDRERPA
jgi:hypothetical protein